MTRRVASSAAVGRRLEELGHVRALAELAADAEVGGGRRHPVVQQHRHEDAAHHLGLGPEPLVLEHPLADDGRRPDRLTELDLVLEHPPAPESIHVTGRRDVLERGRPDRTARRVSPEGSNSPRSTAAASTAMSDQRPPWLRRTRLQRSASIVRTTGRTGPSRTAERGGPAELVEGEADRPSGGGSRAPRRRRRPPGSGAATSTRTCRAGRARRRRARPGPPRCGPAGPEARARWRPTDRLPSPPALARPRSLSLSQARSRSRSSVSVSPRASVSDPDPVPRGSAATTAGGEAEITAWAVGTPKPDPDGPGADAARGSSVPRPGPGRRRRGR